MGNAPCQVNLLWVLTEAVPSIYRYLKNGALPLGTDTNNCQLAV